MLVVVKALHSSKWLQSLVTRSLRGLLDMSKMEIDFGGGGKKRKATSYKKRKVTKKSVVMAKAGELKWVDQLRSAMDFTSTVDFDIQNGLIPGVGVNNRVGRKIKMKSLTIYGDIVRRLTNAASNNDHLRLMLIYDRQPNGAVPGLSDVLQSTDVSGTTQTNAQAMLNLTNGERFKVLRDWHWKLDQTAISAPLPNIEDAQVTSGHVSPCQFKVYIPLKGLPVSYNAGVAGTQADIATGALYLMSLGLNAAGTATHSLIYTSRLRFYDA